MGLIDQIIGVESGGNATATNPRSSATGAGQFLSATWLDMLAKHRPDLTGSPEQLLAMRNDPALSKAMTEAYAADNGQILSKAGHETSPGNTYLAHFAGPQGAVSVLGANPATPVGQILGDKVVKANPFLANMTVADLRAWADKKMGGSSAAPSGQTAPMTPAALPQGQMPPFMPQQTAAPLPAGAFTPFAPQQQSQGGSPSLFEQMPAEQPGTAPPPIFAGQRKPIDLSKLRAALQASGNRGLIFSKDS